jgi:protein-tyrosine phosphatase
MFNRILMVCLGNICRSPMAEGILKHNLIATRPDIQVSSAGLAAIVDHPAATIACSLLQTRKIDLSAHAARQLTDTMVREADLILVMERQQKKKIESLYPYALGKVFLLGKWDDIEIPDPWNSPRSEYENALALIDKALVDWQKKICPQ